MKIVYLYYLYLNINKCKFKMDISSSDTYSPHNITHLSCFKDIENAITSSSQYVIVIDCYTKWCGPCKLLSPKLEEIQNKYNDEKLKVKIFKMDIESNEEIRSWTSMKEVESIPTIFIIKDNKDVGIIEGADVNKIDKIVRHYSKKD